MNDYLTDPDPFKLGWHVSKKLASVLSAQPKECWKNAILALKILDEAKPLVGIPQYCEGYVLLTDLGIHIEHGWVIYQEYIIDPTLALSVERHALQEYKYFAGTIYTANEIDRFMDKADDNGIMLPLFLHQNDVRLAKAQWQANLRCWRYQAKAQPELTRIIGELEKSYAI